jgi:hypothetical protein
VVAIDEHTHRLSGHVGGTGHVDTGEGSSDHCLQRDQQDGPLVVAADCLDIRLRVALPRPDVCAGPWSRDHHAPCELGHRFQQRVVHRRRVVQVVCWLVTKDS